MCEGTRIRHAGFAGVLAAVLAVLCALTAVLPAHASADATYSYEQTIPVPPASSYAGGGGGDGWAVALTPTAVYNVFHHSGQLRVACHRQSDASACWAPQTVTDANGSNFAVSGQPGLWLDQADGHLYVFATRSSDATGGVVCVDTEKLPADSGFFCGFILLTVAGDAPANSGISNGALVGSRWYAFNYVHGSPSSGGKNTLLCFDTATSSPCAGQPFSVAFGGGTVSAPSASFRVPAVTAIAEQVVIPINAGAERIACFDGATSTACGGSWPAPLAFAYSTNYGAAFPTLNASGVTTGLCLPSPGLPCFDLSGSPATTPAGLTGAISAGTPWNGPALAIGPRVYVPNGDVDQVQCFDFGAAASCPNFPKPLPGLGYLYTVNPDPQRADCIWVNADFGAGQIQNFDAYSGAGCGQGPIRVLASSIVVPTERCAPTSYSSLQVIAPQRAAYTSGSVAFLDGGGRPISGIADRSLDGTGAVNLMDLNLMAATGLPQFLITLVETQGTPSSVVVKLVWKGVDDPSCVRPGTVVEPGTTRYRIDMKAWIPHDGVVDPEQPITLGYALASLIHTPCHRPSLFLRPFTVVTTRYAGDGHAGYDGSYRVRSSLAFDWDGVIISNVDIPDGARFGTTVLRGTYRNPLNTNSCDIFRRTATESATSAASGSSFTVGYSAVNPGPRLPSPAIDGRVTGSIAADGTIRFGFRSDGFPSHGVRVSKAGVSQLTDIVNDVSCLPDFAVIGLQGIATISAGLTALSNEGDRTVSPTDSGLTARTNADLCLGF